MVECRNHQRRIERTNLILFNRFQTIFDGVNDKFSMPLDLKRARQDTDLEEESEDKKKMKVTYSCQGLERSHSCK